MVCYRHTQRQPVVVAHQAVQLKADIDQSCTEFGDRGIASFAAAAKKLVAKKIKESGLVTTTLVEVVNCATVGTGRARRAGSEITATARFTNFVSTAALSTAMSQLKGRVISYRFEFGAKGKMKATFKGVGPVTVVEIEEPPTHATTPAKPGVTTTPDRIICTSQATCAGASRVMIKAVSITWVTPPLQGIPDKEFEGATFLVDVDMTAYVQTIGDYAFFDCSNLERVNIPYGVVSIGAGAFAGANLQSVDIPASVTAIYSGAFANNRRLDSITIPTSVVVYPTTKLPFLGTACCDDGNDEHGSVGCMFQPGVQVVKCVVTKESTAPPIVTKPTTVATTTAVAAAYRHVVRGCVSGENVHVYTGKDVAECGALCSANHQCKAFEYGVSPRRDATGTFDPRVCRLQSSIDTAGCNGTAHNLDLYIKLPIAATTTRAPATTTTPTTAATPTWEFVDATTDEQGLPRSGLRLLNGDVSDRWAAETKTACEVLCNANNACTGYGFGQVKKQSTCYQLKGSQHEIKSKLARKNLHQRGWWVSFKVATPPPSATATQAPASKQAPSICIHQHRFYNGYKVDSFKIDPTKDSGTPGSTLPGLCASTAEPQMAAVIL